MKYKVGKFITDISELPKQEFIYHRHKILHKGWFMSWQFRYAVQLIERKQLLYAIKKEEENKC